MPVGMGIKSISETYMESHVVSHTRTRLKGDKVVNSVINATLERESDYTRGKNTTTEAEATFTTAVNLVSPEGIVPTFIGENAHTLQHQYDDKVRKEVKKLLCWENNEKWCEHFKIFAVQGKFLVLAAAEKEDIVWKSYMFNLKQGTLKFLLNAAVDTLPTAANLKRWRGFYPS